jgi:tRNA A-37 threonylcarbamoyl transferase component Bud32
VQKVIGDGGMGSVFLAEHVTLRKKVALKVLHPELCRDQTHVDRFLQEARAASMIDHDNIVNIVDFGTVPGGSVVFAMEYLEGRDLSGALRADGRMPWPRVQNFMLQIVRALNAAHAKGIVHRDLKPANCFVVTKSDGREFIKLLDFGIAKVTDSENDKGLTRTGAVFGTAKYMAPEQACGETADGRTDIYATAVLMYELLTGVVPFDGDNFMRVLSRHLTEPLTLPSTMAPDAGIPPMVESIVVKALSKKREDRYQSMGEFEAALLALGPDGTLKAGGMGMGGLAYSAPMTAPPRAGSGMQPAADAPGHTQWLGPSVQASQGPTSQPPEGRGGTLLLDGDSAPPGFMNQPGIQGPTGWSAASGGTMMMDGMGQDILPGPGGAAITRNPPMMGGGMHPGTNPPPAETRPPMGSDPMYDGYEEPSSRKGLLVLALGGAVAAIGLGGLVAWLLLDEPTPETPTDTTPVVVVKKDPETKTPPPPETDIKVPPPETDTKVPPEPETDTKVPPEPAGDDGEVAIDDDGGTEPSDTAGQPPDPVPDSDPDKPETKTTRPTPKKNNPPKVKDVRDAKDLSKGWGKAATAAKACGKTNGALPGQKIVVEATINSSGSVVSASVSGPSRTSPLGKCVASAVKGNARFVQSKQPLQIEKHEYKM